MARRADAADQGRDKPDWGRPAPGPRAGKAAPPAAARKGATKRTAKRTAKPAPASRSAKAGASSRAAAKPAASGRAAKATRAGSRTTKTTKAPERAVVPKRAGRGRGRAAPKTAARARAARSRYAVVHDLEGPRVRLGICWFLLALPAIAVGPFTTAIVYTSAAGIAAAQAARCWRKRGARPNELMAASGAALVGAGALFGAGGGGLGMLVAVVLAFVGAAGDVRSPNPRLADVGTTLQCALAPGLVAMSMVLLTRLDQGSAIALLLLVSAFETGDFLIGSGARNPYEGPASGAAGIVVVTFIISTLPISTLSFSEAWVFGFSVAVLAPAGQLLASAVLPSATAPASALRRLDSLLIVAPLWAWGVGLVV